mmetsp:Transcript_12472/g.20326  ORF Transcript_12472/g.20326 Transcript_12472/m.20326 type:complete len:255 (+) Transcript_12472:1275-2039(+)
MGMVPATCRTSSSVDECTSHRWRERPWREEFSLMRLSLKAVVTDDDEEFFLGDTAGCNFLVDVVLVTASSNALSGGCAMLVVAPECSSSELLTTMFVLTTSKGGSFFTVNEATNAISFPMALRPHDPAEDVVITVEFDDMKGFPSVDIAVRLSGISSILSSLTSPFNINAFLAHLSASSCEKQTPTALKSSIFDATFFNDRSKQTGGAFTLPCPVGVILPVAGVSSLPYVDLIFLFVGTGEMFLLLALPENRSI